MSQTCSQCARMNPSEAVYCYYDGTALSTGQHDGRSARPDSGHFHSPFVFPTGQVCRNFDELALACQNDWAVSLDLLQQGYLENFFVGLGRTDLAHAAREAARSADRDQGLDRLLAQLPSNALEPPQLRVEPQEIHLGVITVDSKRQFDLHLENQGMRLLYGSIACENCLWLSLGDSPGTSKKLFQFGSETTIPVHVQGKHLRASSKPIEAQLVVTSNGGVRAVTIRADVPIQPFSAGVLAGARSPRQIAEKAKAAPKEAAVLFAQGAVAQWYRDNGWSYPVQGPAASGLGAVQQFFEALGLTPPPKVDISERSIVLQARPGEKVCHTLEVRAQEKRPVYAHGTSNQPWLEIGRAQLNGRTATIPLVVPTVPDREGETITAKVIILANGNQRFVVPVTLSIGGSFDFDKSASDAMLAKETPPLAVPATLAVVAPRLATSKSKTPMGSIASLFHLFPTLLLLLALLAILVADITKKSDGPKPIRYSRRLDLLDPEPRLDIQFEDNGRFGITMRHERDPKNPDKRKRLTYEEKGSTNNTCVQIDGHEYLFGAKGPQRNWVPKYKLNKLKDGIGWESQFEFKEENILVTQIVELVPGAQTRVLDTCLIRYLVENRSTVAHRVGLRLLLDTYIGANDGTPFVIPGQPGILQTMRRFTQKEIPDYIQTLEHADLRNPGTIAHMGLKLPLDDVEAIESMTICHWPGNKDIRWDWDLIPMNQPPNNKDSSVSLYWAYRKMDPGEKREMAITYGLNTLSSSNDAQLALTAGGSFQPHKEFTITAYLKDPKAGQVVRLNLPPGLSLVQGEEPEQKIDASEDYSQVSWRVRAERTGTYTVEATSEFVKGTYQVRITDRSFLD